MANNSLRPNWFVSTPSSTYLAFQPTATVQEWLTLRVWSKVAWAIAMLWHRWGDERRVWGMVDGKKSHIDIYHIHKHTDIQTDIRTYICTGPYMILHDESYMREYMNTWMHLHTHPCLIFFPFPTHIYANKNDNDSACFDSGYPAALWGFQREQACDLHGQRLQRWVANRGQQARLAKSQYHAQGHCNLEFREEQDPRPDCHVWRCDFVLHLMLWTFFPFCKASQVSSDVVLHSRLQDQIFALSLHNLAVFHIHRHLQASLNSTADIRWMVEGMLADFDMFRKETVGDPKDLHSRGDWGTSGSDVWKLYLFNVLWSLPCIHASFCLCLTVVVVFVACWLWFPLKGSLLCLGSNIFCLVQGQVTSTGNKNITKYPIAVS